MVRELSNSNARAASKHTGRFMDALFITGTFVERSWREPARQCAAAMALLCQRHIEPG
jgi:hypothetical protein